MPACEPPPCSPLFFLFASASVLTLPKAQAENFRSMKYGFFVHYVWGGDAYSATVNKDGSKPKGLDDLADRFDAEGFARDIQAMNVEYVLFTAWHADMNVLYPSKVMEKWRPGHSAKRDLIGDMIKACKAKGISVLLYTHPRDGHDFTDADMAKTGWHRGQGRTRISTNGTARSGTTSSTRPTANWWTATAMTSSASTSTKAAVKPTAIAWWIIRGCARPSPESIRTC